MGSYTINDTLFMIQGALDKAPPFFTGKDRFYNAAVTYLEQHDAQKALLHIVEDFESKGKEQRFGRGAVWKVILCDLCSKLHGQELRIDMVAAAQELEHKNKLRDGEVFSLVYEVAHEMNRNSGLREIVPEDRRRG